MTPHCPACCRRWPAGVPGCPCLDDDTPAANDPAWGDSGATLAALGCLGAVLTVGGWVVVWAVWQGVRGGLRAVGMWP